MQIVSYIVDVVVGKITFLLAIFAFMYICMYICMDESINLNFCLWIFYALNYRQQRTEAILPNQKPSAGSNNNNNTKR